MGTSQRLRLHVVCWRRIAVVAEWSSLCCLPRLCSTHCWAGGERAQHDETAAQQRSVRADGREQFEGDLRIIVACEHASEEDEQRRKKRSGGGNTDKAESEHSCDETTTAAPICPVHLSSSCSLFAPVFAIMSAMFADGLGRLAALCVLSAREPLAAPAGGAAAEEEARGTPRAADSTDEDMRVEEAAAEACARICAAEVKLMRSDDAAVCTLRRSGPHTTLLKR